MCLYANKVVSSSERYMRLEFSANQAFPSIVDDAEFYFTPGDALIQFRSARRSGPTDFGANRRRMDNIRVALNFESVSWETHTSDNLEVHRYSKHSFTGCVQLHGPQMSAWSAP